MTLHIYLIRHGETAWSLSGQHTGHTDLPLTPHGEATARDLSWVLPVRAFSMVLTSPRLRARATCDLAGLGGNAQIEPDLAEWNYGEYEGLTTAEIRKLRPNWNVWEYGCPGGETPADVSARADRLIARFRDLTGEVALFSHGHFGRVFAARWIGLPAAQGRHLVLEPASVSILGAEADHPNVRNISLWNATASGRLFAV